MNEILNLDIALGAISTLALCLLVFFLFLQTKKVYATNVYVTLYGQNEIGTEIPLMEFKLQSHLYTRKGSAETHVKHEIEHTQSLFQSIIKNESLDGIIIDPSILLQVTREIDIKSIKAHYVHGKVQTVVLSDFRPYIYSQWR